MSRTTNYQTLISRGRKAGLNTRDLYSAMSATPAEGGDRAPGQSDGNGFVSTVTQRGPGLPAHRRRDEGLIASFAIRNKNGRRHRRVSRAVSLSLPRTYNSDVVRRGMTFSRDPRGSASGAAKTTERAPCGGSGPRPSAPNAP